MNNWHKQCIFVFVFQVSFSSYFITCSMHHMACLSTEINLILHLSFMKILNLIFFMIPCKIRQFVQLLLLTEILKYKSMPGVQSNCMYMMDICLQSSEKWSEAAKWLNCHSISTKKKDFKINYFIKGILKIQWFQFKL